MKRELFQEIQIGRTARCAIDHVAYPDALYGIISFLEHTNMSISLLRFGRDGIELATDPSNEAAYIEYNQYYDAVLFEKRKQEYQDYLNEQAVKCGKTDSQYAKDYILRNHHEVMLYANDEKCILIYKDAPQIMTEERKYFLTSVFLPLIHVSLNGELSDSAFPEVGFPHSPLLPRRQKPRYYEQTKLRYDGLYIMDFENELETNLSSFLRFFPNGMMTGCLSDKTATDKVYLQLDEETPYFGSYRIKEDKIEMHITGIGFDETSRLIGTIHDGFIQIEDDPTFVDRAIWNTPSRHEHFVFYIVNGI